MTKQSYSSSVNEAFDRTYAEVHDDLYLSGVRPDDSPRISWFGILGVIALFIAIGWVAAHIF